MKLSIITIIDYVGGEKKRPVIEGEALLDAGHIIMCGVKDEGKGFAKIEALCLQTSDLNGRPHKIDVLLKEEKETVHISGSCSCKAGASSKCKHFVGTLLHVNRYVNSIFGIVNKFLFVTLKLMTLSIFPELQLKGWNGSVAQI